MFCPKRSAWCLREGLEGARVRLRLDSTGRAGKGRSGCLRAGGKNSEAPDKLPLGAGICGVGGVTSPLSGGRTWRSLSRVLVLLPAPPIGGSGRRPYACSALEPRPQAVHPLRMPSLRSPARRRCALCACPARDPCLQLALSHRAPGGAGSPNSALGGGSRKESVVAGHLSTPSSIPRLRSRGGIRLSLCVTLIC